MNSQRLAKDNQAKHQKSAKSPEGNAPLTVGRANDIEEDFADKMANRALQTLNSPIAVEPVDISRHATAPSTTVRRSLTVGRAADREEAVADEMADRALSQLRRKESHSPADPSDPLGGTQVDSGTERQISALRGKGSSLRERELHGFSDAYGVDLSATRVHQSPQADELSRNLQADAFTVGNDVFFRRGLYNPGTSSGDRLLGHELAHVAIQSGGGLSRMASRAGLQSREFRESKSESNASDLLANRQLSTQPMKQIRREPSAKQVVDSAEPEAEGPALPKRERRNAFSIPSLMSLEDFTKAAKGNWSYHWFTNATDVLKEKLTAYHGSELDFDARYQLAHEIDEICNAYLVKRTVELGKQAGSGEDPKTKLNQSGKDDKIAAIGDLGQQAKSVKAAIERSGLLGGSVEDLKTQAGEDKKVKKMKAKYTPQTAGTFFAGLGHTLNFMAGQPGQYKEMEIKVMFPAGAPGLWAGFVIGIKADQDFNGGKGGAIHAELEVKGRFEAGINVGFGKLEFGGEVGFFLDAKAPDGQRLGSMLSLGAYDNFRKILYESTVNTMWFGWNSNEFNAAKSDEWMSRIVSELNSYPEANEKKYKDNPDLLAADRLRWAEAAEETYVRSGFLAGADATAKFELGEKVVHSQNVAVKGRVGTEITKESLEKYAKSASHDRSYSTRFKSWEYPYEFIMKGWKGAYKIGQEYSGGDSYLDQEGTGGTVKDIFEGEFKAPAGWPASALSSWLAGFVKSYLLNETAANKRKDAAEDTALALVFSSPQFVDLANQVDQVQKEKSLVNQNFGDDAGYGDKEGGVVVRLKIEAKKGKEVEVTLIAGAQMDFDRETPEALQVVKVGAKGKIGQTFADKKIKYPYPG